MIIFSVLVLWIGSHLVFRFVVEGSYVDLAVVFIVGSLSLISLGLVVASRGTSEEFTDGLLNLITWPMMFLSGVWFSIEGAPRWIQAVSWMFPLTHMLSGARKIMNDGATLAGVQSELMVLTGMTICFLAIGAIMFKWNK
jgi:ABC-type multidrug transport system permease subunit